LAIVRHVAHNHGATVKVDSVVGLGSRFALIFPAAAADLV
jgi:two-component system phosphate regulon sensor histidine kinase PhoR